MGKNKKRKCNSVHAAPNGGDSHGRSKRQRPSTTDEGSGLAGMVHPRVDPVTGQHGAFPGLDDDDPDELFYGPANDGLGYLRMVRSEARGVPQLLVAPRDDGNDEIYDSGVGDSRGFYEGGAYTAAPTLGPTPPSDLEQKSPMVIYLDRLISRFKAHRENLRCTPPAGAVQALSKDHPISCDATRASYSWWHRLLRATDPLPVQLSAMDQVTVLRLIRLITKNGFLKRDRVFDTRVGRWTWGLLGRVDDVGVMGSQEVGVVRDLGKRAVWVAEGLKERDRWYAKAEVEEIEGDELSEGVEEYMDIGEVEGAEGAVLDRDKLEPVLGGEHTIYTSAAPATHHVTTIPRGEEELEEGEISDSPRALANTAADELEAAKARLMARVSAAERNSVPDNGYNGDNGTKEEEGTLATGEKYREGLSNMRGTLNMIITVVGELYGQRDLLKHRDHLWEPAG